MKIVVVLFAVVIAVLVMVEAHGGGPGGRPGRGRPPKGQGDNSTSTNDTNSEGFQGRRRGPRGRGRSPHFFGGPGPEFFRSGDKYNWTREDKINETAFVPNGTQLVIVTSFVPKRSNSSITGSSTFYDFRNKTAVALIVPWKKFCPCFYIPSVLLTFSEAVDQIKTRNTSREAVKIPASAPLNASGAPLTSQERQSINETNPRILKACGGRPIVLALAPSADGVQATNATTITVDTLDSQYVITFIQPPRQKDSSSSEEDSSSEDRDRGRPRGRGPRRGGPRRG